MAVKAARNVASKQIRRPTGSNSMEKDKEFSRTLHELHLDKEEMIGLYRVLLVADDLIGNGTFKGFCSKAVSNLLTDMERFLGKIRPLLNKNEIEKLRNTLIPAEGIVKLEDSSLQRIKVAGLDGKKIKAL